jgi:RHS repeat-associated protein
MFPLTPYSDDNRYQYNGKEFEQVANLLDYGWRWYDPVIGRWNGVDPLAEYAPAWTPYRYGFNNPILYIDPDGLFESRADAREYRRNSTDLNRRNSSIRKNDQGTYDIRSAGGDDKTSMRINRNSDGEVISSASAKPYEAGNLKNFMNWAFNLFKEGEKQQHSGENWYLLGDGSPTGFEINAPHANPDGESKIIDISDMQFPGKVRGGAGETVEWVMDLHKLYEIYSKNRGLGNHSKEVPHQHAVDSFCNSCNGPPHHNFPYRRVDIDGIPIDTIK